MSDSRPAKASLSAEEIERAVQAVVAIGPSEHHVEAAEQAIGRAFGLPTREAEPILTAISERVAPKPADRARNVADGEPPRLMRGIWVRTNEQAESEHDAGRREREKRAAAAAGGA